jgi:putative two-component system response regulator
VLVVDDGLEFADVVRRILAARGWDVSVANSGEHAMARIEERQPDVVLLDVVMPGIDGFEICRRIKANPATRLIPVILLTGLTGREGRIRGIEVGADDFLAKPPDWQELTARVRALIRLKRYTDDLDSAESVMLSLAMTIEIRDPYTEGHCQRLANYASALGERLGLADEELETLYQGGFLHDLGKIGIPDGVLLKPGPLTAWEFDLVKQHPIVGARLCDGLRSLRLVRPIVRHHHERLDGTGYPDGLAGDDIPLLAQILSIVDVYDALTTPRPYRPAVLRAEACESLLQEVGKGWRNGELVREFIAIDSGRLVPRADNDAMLRMRFGLEAKRPFPVLATRRTGEGGEDAPARPRFGAVAGLAPAPFKTRSGERAG